MLVVVLKQCCMDEPKQREVRRDSVDNFNSYLVIRHGDLGQGTKREIETRGVGARVVETCLKLNAAFLTCIEL